MARKPTVLAKKVRRTPNVSPTFRALALYALDAEHDGAKLSSGSHPEPTIIVLGSFSDKIEGVIAESEALAALNRGKGNNTAHVVISLESGRSLTDAEWREAANIALKNLNMEGHIALLAVHHNTENQHGHLVINRVCPEPDAKDRYLIRTDGGSVCSKGKDGRMRTNEVLSLHRAAAEISIRQGWPLSENGRFGPGLQLRKADKLRLSSGSATAQALGKDSPELRTALAAQAALAKARETSVGAEFWIKARRELADAGITWKVTEHPRKGKIVYGGKLTGEDGTNVKQSRLEDAYQIKALVAEFGPPPAANAPAKITKEEAISLASPVLTGSQDWPTIHSGLGEHGLSLERKGQGAVIKYNGGKDELKLSDVTREFTFGKLVKRFGTFQENANVTEDQIPTAKPARLPKGVARVELPEARAAALYYEARNTSHPTAYLAIRGLTPTQIVQVGKTGEKLESERRERAEARPTPTVKPMIKDHVLPRNLSEALDEIMMEMEQLSRSNAAMRRIRAAVAAAEADEAKARQMLDEAKKQKALETRQPIKITTKKEDNEMFSIFKRKAQDVPEAYGENDENPMWTYTYQPERKAFVHESGDEIPLSVALKRLEYTRFEEADDLKSVSAEIRTPVPGNPDREYVDRIKVNLCDVDLITLPSEYGFFSKIPDNWQEVQAKQAAVAGEKLETTVELTRPLDCRAELVFEGHEFWLWHRTPLRDVIPPAADIEQSMNIDPLGMDDPLDLGDPLDDVPLDMADDDLDGPRM